MSLLAGFANSFSPLYFEVTHLKEVMSTEHPCDLAYEFGDGLFDIHEYPEGFPAPGMILKSFFVSLFTLIKSHQMYWFFLDTISNLLLFMLVNCDEDVFHERNDD